MNWEIVLQISSLFVNILLLFKEDKRWIDRRTRSFTFTTYNYFVNVQIYLERIFAE